MEPANAPRSLDDFSALREYLTLARARKWWIVLPTLLILGLALFYSYSETPLYAAHGRLLVRSLPTESSLYAGTNFVPPVNLETEVQLFASVPVAESVAKARDDGTSPHQLLSRLDVAPASDAAEVLDFSYVDEDPEVASETAALFAENYLEFKREVALETIGEGRAAIQARMDETEEELVEIESEVASTPQEEETARVELIVRRNVLLARIAVLEDRLDEYDGSLLGGASPGTVIEPPLPPTAPASPDHTRHGVLGAFMGVVAGFGLAYARDRLDDRFRGRNDVLHIFEAPVLAMVPKVSVSRRSKHSLVTLEDPTGLASEAYRNLRTSVEFVASEGGVRSVLITSSMPGEGKTTTAANLAVTVAQAGREVIVVSGDLRRPSLENYFGVENSEGLSEWLSSDGGDPTDLLRSSGVANLRLITTGQVPENPAELVASPRFTDLVRILESYADLVFFDTPPITVADPLILTSRVGGTVVVIDSHRTTRSAATHARQEVERMGGRILGCVLNSFEGPKGYGYNRYGYGPVRPRRSMRLLPGRR